MLSPKQAQMVAASLSAASAGVGADALADDVPPMPQRIGAYRILRVISAAGGMGIVYEAQQDHTHHIVALKVLKRELVSRTAMRRFQHETEFLARLHHPGIAQIYEAGTFDDGSGAVPYFAMEFIENAQPITRYADEQGLGVRARLEMFAQVCDAVHHGHQKGIIHRDLKPANILVGTDEKSTSPQVQKSKEGEAAGDHPSTINPAPLAPGSAGGRDAGGHDAGGRNSALSTQHSALSPPLPKIIDFGIARATDADVTLTTIQTDARTLIGTLQYMSPEQCGGNPLPLSL